LGLTLKSRFTCTQPSFSLLCEPTSGFLFPFSPPLTLWTFFASCWKRESLSYLLPRFLFFFLIGCIYGMRTPPLTPLPPFFEEIPGRFHSNFLFFPIGVFSVPSLWFSGRCGHPVGDLRSFFPRKATCIYLFFQG